MAELPFLHRAALLAAALVLTACAHVPPENADTRLAALAAADVVLLGEQHDAPDHHALERETTSRLASDGRLAALTLEMAERGRHTRGLPASATEEDVRQALDWNEKGWPWAHYGPTVMSAVRAGIPVLGANLPRSGMRAAMADESLERLVPPAALPMLQEAIREGHCNLLPESQIAPMARIQIARDRSMAAVLADAARPGKVVMLVAGAGHVDRRMGVPLHLPSDLRSLAIGMQAGTAPERAGVYDRVWPTPALPPQDHCATLRPSR